MWVQHPNNEKVFPSGTPIPRDPDYTFSEAEQWPYPRGLGTLLFQAIRGAFTTCLRGGPKKTGWALEAVEQLPVELFTVVGVML